MITQERSGLARLQAAAIAVILVAAAGGGLFFVANQSAGNPTGQSSTQAQSTLLTITETGGPASSSQATSTQGTPTVTAGTTTTLSCASSTTTGLSTVPDYVPLFSTVSQMTMYLQQDTVDPSGRTNSSQAQASYQVLGQPTINSTSFYEVRMQATSNGVSHSALALVDRYGNVAVVNVNGQNSTGFTAEAIVYQLMIPFGYEMNIDQQLSIYANPSLSKVVNQTTVALGGADVPVTYMAPNVLPYAVSICGQTGTVSNLLIAYGTVPGTSAKLITYYTSSSSSGGSSSTFTFRLLLVKP